MGKTYEEIIAKIDEHLKYSGIRQYSDFYVGVAKNAAERLFFNHHVLEKGQWWIYLSADSPETARKVEKHYLDLGMRGGNNPDETDAYKVYCYAVTYYTSERIKKNEREYSE